MNPRRRGGIAWLYALALLGLAFVALSLAANVLASFSTEADPTSLTLANYLAMLGDAALPMAIVRTVVLGLGSIAVMLAFGFPIAWLLARTDFRWKRSVFLLLTAKLAVPGFITAMAYIWLFNPTSGIVNRLSGTTGIGQTPAFDIYSLAWICFLQGLVLTPAAVFMMLPAFRNMDASLEEAAWVSGVSRGRAMWRIVLPLLKPGVFAAGLFFFVIAIEAFDFVGLIGMPGGINVLVILIYDAMHPMSGLPDYGYAGAIGMILFLLCGGAVAFYMRFLRQSERFVTVGGKGRAFAPLPLGRWQGPAAAFVAVWVILAFVVPVVTLFWVSLVPYLQPPSAAAMASLSVKGYAFALHYMAGPLGNTLIVMAGAIILAASWSVAISWIVTRSRGRGARAIDFAVFLAPAVPSMVAAVAFQYLGIAIYKWLPIYGTVWLISIAMGSRMLAFCTRTLNAASIQIGYELDEAAYVSGVSRLTAFRRIFLPIMLPAVFYSSLMVGMLSARELTVPLMMSADKSPLVSTLIYNLQTNGEHNVAAAVGLYMIAILLILTVLARRLTGVEEQGGMAVERRAARRRTLAPARWVRGMGRLRSAPAARYDG